MGSKYGGWVIPKGQLTFSSICYCAGCGEDISFDVDLIKRYQCTVYAFDPTPRSIAFVERKMKGQSSYKFEPIGLWSEDTTIRFYAPKDVEHVSHSITNLQETDEFFEAEVRCLKSIMAQNEHEKIDLLKADIEGAELELLDSIIGSDLKIGILCIEFDSLVKANAANVSRVRETIASLSHMGYDLFWVEGRNFTFAYRL